MQEILKHLKNCAVCNYVQISYSDSHSFLGDERVYRLCCKCRKHVMGADIEGVVREWNRIAQLEKMEDKHE